MALNASGPISLAGTTAGQSIAIELGASGTAQISLNDTNVRSLAGVASGAIVMPTNFYGKSNRPSASFTYSADTTNASLNITTLSGYVAGNTDVTITINSGIYIRSSVRTTPALTLTGGATGDTVTVVNNGFIIGKGGAGAGINPGDVLVAATTGGPAIQLGFNTTINNTNASAYIGGGGGGGGSGYGVVSSIKRGASGGGGAGGGNGGVAPNGAGGTIAGGVGSTTPGTSGANGNIATTNNASGGGGGLIIPGTTTAGPTRTTAGASAGIGGSAGGSGPVVSTASGTVVGADGGASSSAGGTGTGSVGSARGGGGGGYGASGGAFTSFGLSAPTGSSPAVAGGKAVNLNGFTVTWVSGNTTRVYGAVS